MPTRPLLAATIVATSLACAAPATAAPTSSLSRALGAVSSTLAPQADPACADAETSKPFAPWNDHANYVPVPGGSFEDGLGAFTTRGPVDLVDDNEPWKVGGADHETAAALTDGATLTTGAFCGGLEYPTIRFFARARARAGALHLVVRYTGRDGLLRSQPLGVVPVGSRWAPTTISLTGSGIPLLTGSGLGLALTSLAGDVVVDDLYVDPYRRS